MKIKKLVVVFWALALTVGIVGTASSGTLDDIVKRGELRVAVQSGAAPYAFVDKNGNHAGSMVDFAREMAKRMGVELKILDFDWDGLIPALLSGKADARRHVDEQVVQIAPAGLGQELIQGRGHHRTPPGHGLLLVDEEADRHRLDTVRHQRLEQLAVAGLGTPPHEAQHPRLARAVDIGVEQPYARALQGERQREVHGHGRLADTALARGDRDQILHAGQRLQAVLHGVGHDRARDLELDRPGARQRGAVHA